jgi:hypothetical protein
MERLWKAIKTRYDASAGATVRGLATGGLWLHLAPHNVKKPYLVVSPVTAGVFGTMVTTNVTGNIEDVVIQVSCFVDMYQLETAYSVLEAWKDCFDNQNLAFGTGTGHMLGCRRLSSSSTIITDPDIGHQVVLEYRYWFDEL